LAEAAGAEIEAMAQRQRILNTIRALFYEALGAQRQVELHVELSRVAHDAVNTTVELFNVGQADKPDNLQAQIEAEQVDHELQVARNH
jgi:cobalt-zinc-cadmium efflux system outer membrane protein